MIPYHTIHESEYQHVVVWDGTRDRGPYLRARVEAPAAAPVLMATRRPRQRRRPLPDAVYRHLQSSGPLTVSEISSALAVTVFEAHAALKSLRKRAVVAVVGLRERAVGSYGRGRVNLYGVPR